MKEIAPASTGYEEGLEAGRRVASSWKPSRLTLPEKWRAAATEAANICGAGRGDLSEILANLERWSRENLLDYATDLHRRKVDAPSGTALMLGDAAAQGRGSDLKTLRRGPYDGPDAKRETGTIGFAVRRSGGVIGEHEVLFGAEKELIRLSHTALDRSVFAEGALHAAAWAAGQAPGLYDMNDVLGLGHTG